MFQIVDGVGIGSDETAQRAERLREGAHDEVHLVGQSEMVGSTPALMSQNTQGMGIVKHDFRIVFVRQGHHFRQWDDVSLHGENTVGNDQLDGFGFTLLQTLLQTLHVVVGVLQRFAERQTAAFNDGGVVEAVEKQIIVAAAQRGNHPQVDLEPRAEAQRTVLAHQLGQLILQFHVDIECSVEKTRTGATRAVLVDGGFGRLLQTRIIGKTQIAVRAEHQHILALNLHHRALFRLYFFIIWIDSLCFCDLRRSVLRTFVL